MPEQAARISTFFRRALGAPLANTRWSWGAVNPHTGLLFLRIWADERETVAGIDRVQILGSGWSSSSAGRPERVRHVELLRSGTVAYGVLCTAEDPEASGPRKIAQFDREDLLVLGSPIEEGGFIYAVITGTVPVRQVNQRVGVPRGITAEDVRGALLRLAKGATHPFGVSTGWDVIYEGKRYPQKAVLGLAGERVTGRSLGPYAFMAGECRRALVKLGFPPVRKTDQTTERQEEENAAEAEIRRRTDIGATDKEQLISARRGQGVFKSKLRRIERRCRVTGLADAAHLRASHIKPWCRSTNEERLDGNNGLFLSPHVDHLFDRGFITFSDSGEVLVADILKSAVLKTWSISLPLNVGRFRPEQAKYLDYHRRMVFLGRSE